MKQPLILQSDCVSCKLYEGFGQCYEHGNNLVENCRDYKKNKVMKASEYKHLYALKNKESGNFILYYYWASLHKHKALFSSRKKAEEALCWFNGDYNIEIVEL